MLAAAFPSVCKLTASIDGWRLGGGGSAFVILSDPPTLLTNAHVFAGLRAQAGEDADVIAIFDDGRTFRVVEVAADEEADIAIARVLGPPPPPSAPFRALPLGSSAAVRRGEPVAVLGAPLGGSLTPTAGVAGGLKYVADDELMSSALGQARGGWPLLQVDAGMSSGSSGGPILNAHGEVVAVSVLVQTAGVLSGGVGHANFGVAADHVKPIVAALLQGRAAARPSVGASVVLVDAVQAARAAEAGEPPLLPPGGGFVAGLRVVDVARGRPAAAAGLRPGDVLLELGGRRLTSKGALFEALGPVHDAARPPLRARVWRPAERREVPGVALAPGPREAPAGAAGRREGAARRWLRAARGGAE